jgi:hypothetical protein
MAIRYNKELNARLRREVDNFNKKRKRAIQRGFRQLPPAMKVSELKARYTVRSDLDRELNRLRKFNITNALERVETQGGIDSTSWELKYLKGNVRNARDYFQRELNRASKRVAKFPGEAERVNNIRAKIDILDIDLSYMNQEQFRSAKRAIFEYVEAPAKRKAGYRGFLTEVDLVMQRLGYSQDEIDSVLDKFNELNADQFLYAYDHFDIISRIYELADSPVYGGLKLNTTDEDAENLVDTLREQVDGVITDAKNNVD